jgi:hypothetical protein
MRLVYTRETKHIGTKWSKVTCLALLLVAAQSLLFECLEDYQSSQRLNNNDRKQAIQRINKTVQQIVHKY